VDEKSEENKTKSPKVPDSIGNQSLTSEVMSLVVLNQQTKEKYTPLLFNMINAIFN